MQVTEEIVERLSRYRAVALRLRTMGFVKVFSDNLSDAVNISASQVRKDFAMFGIRGFKRGGYPIAMLVDRLDALLGASPVLRVVVLGCGNIGTALVRSYGRRREGVCVTAAFDIRPERIDPAAEVPVFDVRELVPYLKREQIEVAILTVPEDSAPQMMDTLREAGVRGILNFTACPIRSTPGCVVHTINIGMEIEKLFHLVHFTRIGPHMETAIGQGTTGTENPA